MQILEKEVSRETLPQHLGGNNLTSNICMGGQVKSEIMSLYSPNNIPDMGELKTVKIEPGSDVQIPFTAVTKDCKLRWKFSSEGGDIGFGIRKEKSQSSGPNEDYNKEVLGLKRVQYKPIIFC